MPTEPLWCWNGPLVETRRHLSTNPHFRHALPTWKVCCDRGKATIDACRARDCKDALRTGVEREIGMEEDLLLQLVRETDDLKSEVTQAKQKQSEQDCRLKDAGLRVRELATAQISTEKGNLDNTPVICLDESRFDGTPERAGEQIRTAKRRKAGSSLSVDDSLDLSEIASAEKEMIRVRRDEMEMEEIRFKLKMEQEERKLNIMESELALKKEEAEARHDREIEERKDREEDRKDRAVDRQERLLIMT
jgi:hypothetical protein